MSPPPGSEPLDRRRVDDGAAVVGSRRPALRVSGAANERAASALPRPEFRGPRGTRPRLRSRFGGNRPHSYRRRPFDVVARREPRGHEKLHFGTRDPDGGLVHAPRGPLLGAPPNRRLVSRDRTPGNDPRSRARPSPPLPPPPSP